MIRVLNMGAGVGSTAAYLLSFDGLTDPYAAAVFADTEGEPRGVYRHLDWLRSLGGPPIHAGTLGDLAADLIHGQRGTLRFDSIPAFVAPPATSLPIVGGEREGRLRRQCTRSRKVEVAERVIREQVLGLRRRQRVPDGVTVEQCYGLTDDEPKRIRKVRERMRGHPWAVPRFPLAEIGWTRSRCESYLSGRVPHPVERSACVYCPCHSDTEWVRLRDHDPEAWVRAVELDAAMRRPGAACLRGLDGTPYLHRSLLPLADAPIDAGAAREAASREAASRQGQMFADDDPTLGIDECVGMCGA